MGLYELLTVTEPLKDKINQAPSIEALRRQAMCRTACVRCVWQARCGWRKG